MNESSKTFAGFVDPKVNWFALPNDFFDFINFLRITKSAQITAELKILLFLQAHAWHLPNGVSERQIKIGIKRGRAIIDSGTGLDGRTIQKSLGLLVSVGAIINDNGRYHINTIPQDEDKQTSVLNFAGFPSTEDSYFKVPNVFLGLIAPIKSAVTICVVLYLIRHAWGYRNSAGIWMDAEEIQFGRRKDKGAYDLGTGFDEASIYHSIQEALAAGLIVWSDRNPDGGGARVFNLRFVGAEIDKNNAEYIGQLAWETEDDYLLWLDHRSFTNGGRESVKSSLDFAEPTLDFARPTLDIAESTLDFAKSTLDFVEPTLGFAESTLGFANNTLGFAGKINVINTIKHNKTPEKATENTRQKTPAATVPPTLENLVAVAVGSSPDSLLRLFEVNTKRSRIFALTGGLSCLSILSWAIYSWNQKWIKNPTAYLIQRCHDGDSPPASWLRLVTGPIADLISEFDDIELPETILSLLKPYYVDATDEIDQSCINDSEATIDYMAKKLWDDLKINLQESISVSAYRTWVESSRGLSWDGTILKIASINTSARDWIENNLHNQVSSVLETIYPGSDVLFVVAPPI